MRLPTGWELKQDRPCGWCSLYNELGELMAVGPEETMTQKGVNMAWLSEKTRKEFESKGQLLE